MFEIIDDKKVAIIAAAILLVSGCFAFYEKILTPKEITGIDPKAELWNELHLEAEAVAIYDIKEQKFLFEKNSEIQLPLASLTKIMTAYVVRKNLPEDKIIAVSAKSTKREGDSGLRAGEHYSLRDLLRLTLVRSSNDGASAAALAFEQENNLLPQSFIEKMNDEARELGLLQTYFMNEDGLDYASSTSGGYGSAKDVALLTTYALNEYPEVFGATAYPSITVSSLEKRHIEGRNTNKAIGAIPGLIAGKTGYTDLSDGNLVVIFDVGPEHPVAAVVLGSSFDGRFTDIEKLVQVILRSIALD